jgi:RNA polymerase sigma-70 factor (ECF subfamily)
MVIESGLVDQARGGGAALEQLITAVWPEAYRIALGILRDRGLAEDAAQDACARIAASLSQLNNSGGFASWSYTLIVRQAISVARRRRPLEALDALVERRVEFDRSDAVDLYDALGKLPVQQRAAIILHYYGGFNSSEIAAATGLPASTVRFHLMHARRTLRKALSRECPAAAGCEEVVHDAR